MVKKELYRCYRIKTKKNRGVGSYEKSTAYKSMKVLKILKINLLAIVSIVLFLLAGFFKTIAVIFEKAESVLKIIVACGIVLLGLNALTNPDLQKLLLMLLADVIGLMLIMVILIILIIGIFILIAIMLIRIITALLYAFALLAINLVAGLCDTISYILLSNYQKSNANNLIDYQIVSMATKSNAIAWLCPFYALQKGVEKSITFILSKVRLIGTLFVCILGIGKYLELNQSYLARYGISYIDYWMSKPRTEMLVEFGTFLISILFLCLIVSCLTSDLVEWAKILRKEKPSGESIPTSHEQVEFIQRKEDKAKLEKAQAYFQIVQKHLREFNMLTQRVTDVLSQKDDVLLNLKYHDYLEDIKEITKSIDENGQVKLDKFQIYYAKISSLDAKRIDILELASKLEEQYSKPSANSAYFAGCDTAEKLNARYKQLCKAFHPDSIGGDTESFQKMQQEYENLVNTFSAHC